MRDRFPRENQITRREDGILRGSGGNVRGERCVAGLLRVGVSQVRPRGGGDGDGVLEAGHKAVPKRDPRESEA